MQPTSLLCPWGFSRQEYWSGLPGPPPGDLPNPEIKPQSLALQADSLLSEPPGKPKNTGVGSLTLLQIFLTQESNLGLLHCRHLLYQLNYLWEKCSKEAGVSYVQVCDKGNRQSEQQRSGIKLRNLAFSVWEDARVLSYLGPILFPCSPYGVADDWFLYTLSSSAITEGGGWRHLLDCSFGIPHSYLETRSLIDISCVW